MPSSVQEALQLPLTQNQELRIESSALTLGFLDTDTSRSKYDPQHQHLLPLDYGSYTGSDNFTAL